MESFDDCRIPFSVLMSVYYKENPLFLERSLRSIYDDQILKPTEIVIVKDGSLTDALEESIKSFQKYAPVVEVVLQENSGLGIALNEGLKHCTYDLVARMDSDDIAKPERFYKQITFMQVHQDIDVCSSWIDEFIGDIDNVVSVRKLPEKPDELYKFGKKRSPLNHPVVVFRKKAVISAGGYMHFPLFEDYYLWVRMLLAKSKFYNLQESLLWFRFSPEMIARRGGLKYAKTEYHFIRKLYSLGYTNYVTTITNILIRFVSRSIPNSLRQNLYRIIRL